MREATPENLSPVPLEPISGDCCYRGRVEVRIEPGVLKCFNSCVDEILSRFELLDWEKRWSDARPIERPALQYELSSALAEHPFDLGQVVTRLLGHIVEPFAIDVALPPIVSS